jgi:hypothetical protein
MPMIQIGFDTIDAASRAKAFVSGKISLTA